MRNGADLIIVSATQDVTNKKLICAHHALGGFVNLHYIIIYLLRDNRGGILGSVCGKHHQKVPLGFHAQIALDGLFQTLVESLVVGALDGLHVGV